MIPQERSEAVARGLREAFGVTEFDDIRGLPNRPGADLLFRIVVQGSAFLLRIVIRVADPACHFTCMNTAAQAGLAPRVWYTSPEDKIAITDFVEAGPLPRTEALIRMPRTLRALHALPPFPPRASHLNTSCTFLLGEGTARNALIEQFQAANLLPAAEREELFARYAQVEAVYPRLDRDMVSSHNDLFKPDNILFDGRHMWLVDWEAAFLNDGYADLAVVANQVVTDDAEENIFLHEYFGQPPDEYQRARFFLMQQLAHMFYGMVFLLMGSAGKPIDWSTRVPGFNDFHRRFWTGEVTLVKDDMKLMYGRVHWERLVNNIRRSRFDEAVRIVSDRCRKASTSAR